MDDELKACYDKQYTKLKEAKKVLRELRKLIAEQELGEKLEKMKK